MAIRLLLAVALSLLPLVSSATFAQDNGSGPTKASNSGRKFYNTYPMPPHKRPNDPMRVFPGLEVPVHPERYVWKISGKMVNSTAAPKTSAPVWLLAHGDPKIIGQLPVGTEIKLDNFTYYGRILYYAVPFQAPNSPTSKAKVARDLAWVSGMAIEPASYTPPAK